VIEIVPARLVHVGPIATRMREADRIECAALGRTPKEGLRIGLRTSLAPLTALVDGQAEAMLGIVPGSLIRGSGTAWMLATDAMYRQRRALVAFGRDVLSWLAADFREVGNIVAADNERAIRFLRFLGFRVGGSAEVHGGVAFVRFRMAGRARAFPGKGRLPVRDKPAL
jgi:ribosomal protein S18 acetylase RimI-like enzyme